jgi:DNA end-binding protein Ku
MGQMVRPGFLFPARQTPGGDMRPIWKGYLKCSLVTIPVKLFTAVTKRPLQFHLYHKACGSRIQQENICPVCGQTLSQDEIVKGYQYGKDLHVVLTDDDFAKVQKESTDTINILKFVDAGQINPIYYTDAYYLAPDGAAGAEAFAIFHRAMAATGKTAVARAVMRHREFLYNLRPHDGALIAFTLHYPEEIRAVTEIEAIREVRQVPVDDDNLEMAKTIIAHLSGDFVPADYRDEYTETLLAIIRAKAEGQEVSVEPRQDREKVINLMEALQKSVTATEPGAALKKEMARAGERPPGKPKKRQQA